MKPKLTRLYSTTALISAVEVDGVLGGGSRNIQTLGSPLAGHFFGLLEEKRSQPMLAVSLADVEKFELQ